MNEIYARTGCKLQFYNCFRFRRKLCNIHQQYMLYYVVNAIHKDRYTTRLLYCFYCWTLFFQSINDIVKYTEKFNCILYADDTTSNSTIDCFGKEIHVMEQNISAELQRISKWLELNRLQLNTENQNLCLFQMSQKSIPNLKLIISGSIIEHVNQFKFLGLNIDSNLN